MNEFLFEDQTFRQKDFSGQPLKGKYDNCQFIECDFKNTTFPRVVFVECTFDKCDLSNVTINNTAFREVQFLDCKLLGVNFNHCNPFLLAFTFENSNLNLAGFSALKIEDTHFKNCSLHETDFALADLTGVHFENCDLSNALFENTILEKADFRQAYNFSINPEINRIRKAKFSKLGLQGLLDKYDLEIE